MQVNKINRKVQIKVQFSNFADQLEIEVRDLWQIAAGEILQMGLPIGSRLIILLALDFFLTF